MRHLDTHIFKVIKIVSGHLVYQQLLLNIHVGCFSVVTPSLGWGGGGGGGAGGGT